MPKRRRSFWDLFDEMFREIDEMFREIEEREFRGLRRAFGREFEEGFTEKFGPYVYGFSITIGPDGKPIVREFGNVRRIQGKPRISEEREPLVDVIEDEDQITVVAELPGVEKDNIKVKATEDTLVVSAKGLDKKYYREIPLPTKVKPETARASYKNGVLEVRLEKKEKSKREFEGVEVKVE